MFAYLNGIAASFTCTAAQEGVCVQNISMCHASNHRETIEICYDSDEKTAAALRVPAGVVLQWKSSAVVGVTSCFETSLLMLLSKI